MDNHFRIDRFYQSLEQKKDKVHPSDFRLYNIARLPILANKTFQNSSACAECRANLQLLEKLVDELPDCLNQKHSRKKFETNKNRIESHLKKTHKLRFSTYYSSFFTLLGSITGGLSGFILSLILKRNTSDIVLIFIAIGMITGYIIGKSKDNRKNRQNLQM